MLILLISEVLDAYSDVIVFSDGGFSIWHAEISNDYANLGFIWIFDIGADACESFELYSASIASESLSTISGDDGSTS